MDFEAEEVIERMTVEINGKDQVIMDGVDECEGMFRHGEIAQVVSADKTWTLEIGWSKRA